jgi:hypothetical protein
MGDKRKVRRYRRTTAVGRVAKNVHKAVCAAAVVLERLEAWEIMMTSDGPHDLYMASVAAREASVHLGYLSARVESLVKAGFEAPKKPRRSGFEPGNAVSISEKHVERYLEAYGDAVLRDLVVEKIMTSGQVAVRSPSTGVSFFAVKFHFVKKRAGMGGGGSGGGGGGGRRGQDGGGQAGQGDASAPGAGMSQLAGQGPAGGGELAPRAGVRQGDVPPPAGRFVSEDGSREVGKSEAPEGT